ncbi:hypothetical protein L7F22_012460 [Adiantum nelumboides]|nr:hypothetical protein [Adiantum nelumboides]
MLCQMSILIASRVGSFGVVLLGHEISENGIAPDPAKVECLLMMESPKSTKELMSFVQKLRYLSRSFCMLGEYVHPLQKATQKDPFVWTKYEQEAFENVKDKLSMLPIIMPPCWDDMFYLSLSVGEHAIRAILMQKGKQQSCMRPIYYIRKVKNDVEQTWHDIEQLVWTLVYATKRLKSYLIFKPFVMLTSCSLLPHALKYPGDNAKLQKWLLNLQQFDMSFIKEDSVRANIADMLTFKEINVKNDMKKDLERKIVPSPIMHEELQEVEGTLNFDGAFKRSINKSTAGYVLFDKNGIEDWFGSQEVGVSSNNEAEYASLCVGLNDCIERHVKKLLIKGNSMLVIRQIQGTWKLNKVGMKGWFFKVRRLLKSFHVYQIWHVPRNMNTRAHELVEQVFVKDVHVVTIKEPRYLRRESLYEEEHVLQTVFARKGLSPQQRHAITRRAMKYVITGEHLYHKGVDGVVRRVLYQDEVFDCLKACHEEGCGGHFGVEITRRKVLDAQLMWPSMNRDVVHWCKKFHECQAYQKKKLMPELMDLLKSGVLM